jgi:general secretion pathway protein F
MGAFEYQALDARGKTKKGIASADTARQVRQQLREDGLTPLSVVGVKEQQATSASTPTGGSRRRRIGATELAVITRQFATLLGSGLTVEEALDGLIQQSEGHQTKSTLSGIRSMVMEGRSMAEALRAYPRSFPEIYTASVAAGEETGRLAEVLDHLAEYTETRQAVRERIGGALIYPIFLIVVAVLIVAGLVVYVVPKVVKVFEDTGQELPLLTRLLIAISEFIQQYGLFMGGILLVAVIALTIIFRQPIPRYFLHRTFLVTPGIRRLSRGTNTARMARTLAIMVGSGVPLLSAMKASSEVVVNRALRKALQTAASEVGEGVSLNRAIARSKQFPPLLTQMIASGERSGQLDKMLEKSATALERELESRISIAVRLFEPIMILLMGGIVFAIVLAILLPIFDLNQLIQ